jgi:histidinol-phosphate/aromatic aminotransferase/cobyric acid decarboxylase-like protein
MRTRRPGDAVCADLFSRGIAVRNFSRAPHLADCLRVTIGAREENDAFLDTLAATLAPGRDT